MPRHRHIFVTEPGQARPYTQPRGGGGRFRFPPRDRHAHAENLLTQVSQVKRDAKALEKETGHVIRDLCLEVVGEQGYDLKVQSLESYGIEVLSVCRRDACDYATIYVPEGKLENFVRKIERYKTDKTKGGKGAKPRPKNEDLVTGISDIRLPVLRSFWTDDDSLFPGSDNESIWWEVWIRVAPSENRDNAFTEFVTVLGESRLRVSQHFIKFPERLVFLVFGATREWTRVFVPLLDRLAELRRAKEAPTEFLELTPREEREFVQDLARRISAPKPDAPAVCLLDYGNHSDHPLLRPVVHAEDVQAFDESWTHVDHKKMHGTEMAGIAVFGDGLASLLSNNQPCLVGHRLEAVRMLNSDQAHPEETWGYVTQASLAKAESRAPQRGRVACMPVTADDHGRDGGRPSSWSGAIDEHASGYLDDHRRLYVVAAGNIREITHDDGYVYPRSNLGPYYGDDSAHFTRPGGIEDPGAVAGCGQLHHNRPHPAKKDLQSVVVGGEAVEPTAQVIMILLEHGPSSVLRR